MNILVVGRSGQVARALAAHAWPAGLQVTCRGRETLDLADPALEGKAIADLSATKAGLLVNAGAYTAVDAAEADREAAFRLNAEGPAALARACARQGAAMIQISTDYVFDGTKAGAYVEDDPVAPLGVYGASKAAGEAAVRAALDRHVILRTSWVYDATGKNFLTTMLRLARERDEVRVVDDQHGAPTSAREIARAIAAIVAAGAARPGTYHFTAAGATTWAGFAAAIFAGLAARGLKAPRLTAIPTSAYPTPARRPLNSRLDCSKLTRDYGITGRPWRDEVDHALERALAEGA